VCILYPVVKKEPRAIACAVFAGLSKAVAASGSLEPIRVSKFGFFPGDGQAGSQVNTVASFLFADKLEI